MKAHHFVNRVIKRIEEAYNVGDLEPDEDPFGSDFVDLVIHDEYKKLFPYRRDDAGRWAPLNLKGIEFPKRLQEELKRRQKDPWIDLDTEYDVIFDECFDRWHEREKQKAQRQAVER